MEKLPRSGPLYNAVEEIYSRKNLYGETKPVSEIVQEAAKKYNISAEKLKSVLPYANEAFEEGPLSNPKPEGKIIGGKTFPLSPENAKALGRAVDDDYAARISKLLTEQLEQLKQGVFNTDKKPAEIASKVINTASAPMETPYGKSFLSYTPEGKVAGMAGKALRGLSKVAGPVGAALTAGELGGALAEVRKLGAEKIADENEAKQAGYTPEERLKLKDMLKKLRAEAKLR